MSAPVPPPAQPVAAAARPFARAPEPPSFLGWLKASTTTCDDLRKIGVVRNRHRMTRGALQSELLAHFAANRIKVFFGARLFLKSLRRMRARQPLFSRVPGIPASVSQALVPHCAITYAPVSPTDHVALGVNDYSARALTRWLKTSLTVNDPMTQTPISFGDLRCVSCVVGEDLLWLRRRPDLVEKERQSRARKEALLQDLESSINHFYETVLAGPRRAPAVARSQPPHSGPAASPGPSLLQRALPSFGEGAATIVIGTGVLDHQFSFEGGPALLAEAGGATAEGAPPPSLSAELMGILQLLLGMPPPVEGTSAFSVEPPPTPTIEPSAPGQQQQALPAGAPPPLPLVLAGLGGALPFSFVGGAPGQGRADADEDGSENGQSPPRVAALTLSETRSYMLSVVEAQTDVVVVFQALCLYDIPAALDKVRECSEKWDGTLRDRAAQKESEVEARRLAKRTGFATGLLRLLWRFAQLMHVEEDTLRPRRRGGLKRKAHHARGSYPVPPPLRSRRRTGPPPPRPGPAAPAPSLSSSLSSLTSSEEFPPRVGSSLSSSSLSSSSLSSSSASSSLSDEDNDDDDESLSATVANE